MFNKKKLEEELGKYKSDFSGGWWSAEKYKWEALKTFQEVWNQDAWDFPDMLERALAPTRELLWSPNYYPRRVVVDMTRESTDEVRELFRMLYDEERSAVDRILEFCDRAEALYVRLGHTDPFHYQDVRAVATYLWLRYPDKYYIYKNSEAKNVADFLEYDHPFKQRKVYWAENLRQFYEFYNEVYLYVIGDYELIDLFEHHKDEACYADEKHRTLAADVCHYIAQKIASPRGWLPANYSPMLSVETWVELLQDPEVFTPENLLLMRMMKECGGQATSSQLVEKYGQEASYYNSATTKLARLVAKKANCPRYTENGYVKWWPVLYLGKNTDEGLLWHLRNELATALNRVSLPDAPAEVVKKEEPPKRRGRKPKAKSEPAEAPKRRGRKPKAKSEPTEAPKRRRRRTKVEAEKVENFTMSSFLREVLMDDILYEDIMEALRSWRERLKKKLK